MFKSGDEIQRYINETIRFNIYRRCWIYRDRLMECSAEEVVQIYQFCTSENIKITEVRIGNRNALLFSYEPKLRD